MDIKRRVVLGQLVEEIELLGNVGEHLGALLQKRGDGGGAYLGLFHRPANKRLCGLGKGLGTHGADVFCVKILELFDIEDGRGLGDALYVEYLGKLLHGKYLALAAGAPAEQRDIVYNGIGEIALRDKILIRGVAVALAHLIVRIAHDRRAVDIGRDIPAEALVQQIVFRRA